MPKTHLPGHLDSAREKIRPRHQLLTLKCYPRLPKNATADAKPNSSELSYLLYYGSTRQDKLPKVGAFLEQKTAHDVARWQSARVHVTLQILTAIVDHKEIGGRVSGFTLIAPYVLRIIREIIISTNDISLVEATTNTWDVFCQHQDVATLTADSEYRALYEEVVRLFNSLASNDAKTLGRSTKTVAHHDATRLRKAGVTAIGSIFTPVEVDRKWNIEFNGSFAAVLSNLRHDLQREKDAYEYLRHLTVLSHQSEEEERLSPIKRRQSIATVRTFSGLPDEQELDPRAAEGTAQDADRLEEEEVGVLALGCLKAIFQSENRAQVRGAAVAFMKYVAEEQQRTSTTAGTESDVERWASLLFELITSWTPVQDRFILVITAVETLVRFPLEKSQSFHVATLYNKIILSVLRSDLNLVGLSVIDILLGLINLTVRASALANPSSGSVNGELSGSATTTSQRRGAEELLPYLKDCMANLARHVYYSDQVTDLISFILLRVKANPPPELASDSERPSTGAAVPQDPKHSTNDVSSTTSRPRTQGTGPSIRSGIFATEEGRQVALETISNILKIAQSTLQYSAGSAVISRNRVPLGVWEGSQWLSRDPSDAVRTAYKDALLLWARHEAAEGDEALIDFSADDCIEKLAEKHRPASLHGSLGQSHRSAHPQLLMLPALGAERRMSSGKASSHATTTDDAARPRVRAQDLKDIVEGKRHVPLKIGGGGGAGEVGGGAVAGARDPLDVRALLATIKIDTSRKGLSMAPPY